MTVNNTKLEDEKGRIIRPILINTVKDGSGTWYFPLADSDGKQYVSLGDLITKDSRTSQFVAFGFTDTDIVHIDVQNIQTQTAFMLIDLSDTTNWPHTSTDHINIEYIILEIDPDATFAGEVKLGFLSNVDGDNGDFHQILDLDLVRKSDLVVENIDFGSHGLDLEADHWFGPTTADSTLFQTDVNLLGPDGNTSFPSGDGDLVMLIERSAGAVDVSLTLGYETAA